jgi:hypothetical protein
MGIRGVWMAYPIGFFFSVLLLGRRALRLMNKFGSMKRK